MSQLGTTIVIIGNKKQKREGPQSQWGNLNNFPGDCGKPTADLLTVKLLLNSVISTSGTKLIRIDVKNFYLNTPMERYEYFQLKQEDIPDNIIE